MKFITYICKNMFFNLVHKSTVNFAEQAFDLHDDIVNISAMTDILYRSVKHIFDQEENEKKSC
jgi:hypothetical protein